MAIIGGVLQEELERVKSNIVSYEKLLSKCQKGTVVVQTISGGEYAYLKYRENGKVVSKYLGKPDSKKAQAAIASSKERKRLMANIRKAKKEQVKLLKAIKIYE